MFRPISPITNHESTDRELYQHLYEDGMLNYGSAAHRRCPGVKFYEFYKDELTSPVFDFGCGRGDTVRFLKEKGFEAHGADQIDLENEMDIADITKPMTIDAETALCLDVFEHLSDEDLKGLIKNMLKCSKQIISVHNGPAFEIGCDKGLHINKKTFQAWRIFLTSEGLVVGTFKQLGRQRGLFFCS